MADFSLETIAFSAAAIALLTFISGAVALWLQQKRHVDVMKQHNEVMEHENKRHHEVMAQQDEQFKARGGLDWTMHRENVASK